MLLPGSTIGVLGGGQLGRMLAMEARRMGYRVRALDPDPDACAAPFADVTVAPLDDVEAALELASHCDVLTIETEHVPATVLAQIETRREVHPNAAALATVQDRLRQREFLRRHGLPQTAWAAVDDESLSSIEAEVDRLTRLVGDLLLMAQAETGRMPLTFEPVEIDELVFEVFEQMKTLSGGKHDIRIKNIEPAIVSGDRDRLKQVLLNIGSNAVKFTPEGQQIWFNLAVSGNWVQIEVVDRGPGISKEEIQHIFERFYRGDKSRTRSQKDVGFGLGLPIAYWIVRNHGGRIDVDSKVGDGTVFTIWLPISLAEIPTRPLRTLEHQPQDED